MHMHLSVFFLWFYISLNIRCKIIVIFLELFKM